MENLDIVNNLKVYLVKLCSTLLFDQNNTKVIDCIESTFNSLESTDILSKFASSSDYMSLNVDCINHISGK